MGKMVETVCGPIAVEEVQGALVHEHVIASAPGIPDNYPELLGADRMERIVSELKALKENGINTVCDAAPYDLGRDPKTLKAASEASGVHIIACTGFFTEIDFGVFTEQQIADCLIQDLRTGMDGTDIKAGLIKAMMDRECDTPGRVLLHHAAGMAQAETDVPIFLHSCAELETGRYQIPLLLEAGAKAEKIRIDHITDSPNMEYIRWLYDQGVWLGADRIPRIRKRREYFASEAVRFQLIKDMIEDGMADRMLFSHDRGAVSTLWDTVDEDTLQYVGEEICPDGWLYILKHAVPALIAMGVPEEALHQIIFENPRKYLAS